MPDDHYGYIDPHGFGVMGAFGAALILAGPVLWLLLQQRPAERHHVAGTSSVRARTILALGVIGTPMLIQLTYLRAPPTASWPVVASSLAWFGLTGSVAFNAGRTGPSLHGAFDRCRVASWTSLLAITAAKTGFALYALAH